MNRTVVESKVIESFSDQDTLALATEMADSAAPGDIYTLIGDLGVGKTVFAGGFARALGIDEPVSSPTFTIVQSYDGGRLPFHHFDVYRIGDPEEMEEIGFDDYIFGDGVCLIEWANLIEDIMPDRYTEILIEKDPSKGFDYRRITVSRISA